MVVKILFFLARDLLVQQLTVLPKITYLPAVLLGLAILANIRQWLSFIFVLGMLWAVVFASFSLKDRLPEQLAGQDIQIQGYVADLPEHESNHVRFNFNVLESTKQVPNKLRLTWYYPDHTIKAGQKWIFTVRLKPPHGNFNPGGFDYERWLFVEGIGATGYVRTQTKPKLESSDSSSASLLVWRQQIADKLEKLLADSSSLPLVKALTIGDGNSLTPLQWDIFRRTGTTHLMVISGSHIGLIAGLVYLLTIRLWAWSGVLKWSPQKVAAIVSLATAIFYAGLTGVTVPAQRSALMIAIAMIAIVGQRNTRPFHVLAVALLAVLVIDPLAVLAAGFWLSFIAVSLIIYVIAGRLEKSGAFSGGIKINWVTSVGLAPLLLYFFQQVSLIAPLANLIAVPIISLAVVPLALLATLVMFISPLIAVKIFFVVDIALQGLWWVLIQLADLPISTLTHNQPSWWALCFAVPGILLLFSPKGMPSRSLGLIMLLPLIFTETSKIQPGAFKMTLLDVGQGLSTVIETTNHILVYDTGAKFSSQSDMGQSVLIPFLRSQNIERIDSLIISHGDNDHIGGVRSVMASLPVERILTSVPHQLAEYAPTLCQAGQSWAWDGITFSILSPKVDELLSDNDNSCVLQIQSQQGTALLTGDIEAAAELWLVQTYKGKLKADVLVAPHHGSQTSSSSIFLNMVQPNVILIPAGYRNQFGHPHQVVLQRYQGLHIRSVNSSEAGAIQVDFNNALKLKAWRTSEGRYWNNLATR